MSEVAFVLSDMLLIVDRFHPDCNSNGCRVCQIKERARDALKSHVVEA